MSDERMLDVMFAIKLYNMENIQQPFTNVQLEILKVFSHNLSKEELVDFKLTLAHYFSKKLVAAADKVWDEEGWDNDKVQELLNTKLRKSK